MKSNNFYKDMVIGVCYLAGIVGLMSGEMLISLALIGTASIIGNIHFRLT
jgi:hypothetical protein